MNAIEIKELTKKFGDLTAVNRVNLNIKKGEIFGLLGPNGAGKSTTINMLVGLLNPNKGEILIDGKSIKTSPNQIKSKIGIVPQYLAIYEELTAYENVKFFGSLYGIKGEKLKEHVDYALGFTGLKDAGKKLPKDFSGGMKRRLNIACGIVHKPEIVIMDEPTVGIDPQSRNHILESVIELNKQGTTVIYTSHYMEEVETICSQIAIVDHGKVIAQGTSKELKELIEDKTRFNIELKEKSDRDFKELLKVQGVDKVHAIDRKLDIFIDKGVSSIGHIINYLTANSIEIVGIDTVKPDLELVFLTLTGRHLRDE